MAFQTEPCKNFKDVSLSLASLDPAPNVRLQVGRLFRGGAIDFCSPATLQYPKTVINLRIGDDSQDVPLFTEHQAKYLNLSARNGLEKYDASDKEVKRWINSCLIEIQKLGREDLPLLVHCRFGKDRTGIIIAVLLYILGVEVETIIQEFLLCEDVERRYIEMTLTPLVEKPGAIFRGIKKDKIRALFLDL
eukprot:TRINITY_DN2947_c0_g1_i2.p1 TRINITY_DN2947_c0_g1~~TRINITY_DN2947_c0_g1_i2.p1  ORF type:complete len:219 (-),score=47.64 TRINITY_DN2947_c0_g1_i2:781-1353(-)